MPGIERPTRPTKVCVSHRAKQTLMELDRHETSHEIGAQSDETVSDHRVKFESQFIDDPTNGSTINSPSASSGEPIGGLLTRTFPNPPQRSSDLSPELDDLVDEEWRKPTSKRGLEVINKELASYAARNLSNLSRQSSVTKNATYEPGIP